MDNSVRPKRRYFMDAKINGPAGNGKPEPRVGMVFIPRLRGWGERPRELGECLKFVLSALCPETHAIMQAINNS